MNIKLFSIGMCLYNILNESFNTDSIKMLALPVIAMFQADSKEPGTSPDKGPDTKQATSLTSIMIQFHNGLPMTLKDYLRLFIVNGTKFCLGECVSLKSGGSCPHGYDKCKFAHDHISRWVARVINLNRDNLLDLAKSNVVLYTKKQVCELCSSSECNLGQMGTSSTSVHNESKDEPTFQHMQDVNETQAGLIQALKAEIDSQRRVIESQQEEIESQQEEIESQRTEIEYLQNGRSSYEHYYNYAMLQHQLSQQQQQPSQQQQWPLLPLQPQ